MSIYDSILNTIRTRDEADQLKDEIEILLKSLFQSHKSFEEALKTTVRKSTAEAVISHLRGGVAPQSNVAGTFDVPPAAHLGGVFEKSKPKEFLNGLKEELQKLRVLKVTLAFYPTEKTIDKLFSWVSTNIGKGIILDIEEDQAIMGGAVIEYMGKYLNVSLRKKVEEMFEEKRGEIIGILSSVSS